MSLKDKKVVIIGGSSGIGLATAKAAAAQNAYVLIAGRSREKLTKGPGRDRRGRRRPHAGCDQRG